jgi:hypothetical protein
LFLVNNGLQDRLARILILFTDKTADKTVFGAEKHSFEDIISGSSGLI